ncbi:hypothetical protein [Chryseobacterium sp. 22458]|uniref:hypothetical protein n=1 Tax=Chryseobacterium sp. 22458 TaxID=3453921 RepID=UPI003F84BA19
MKKNNYIIFLIGILSLFACKSNNKLIKEDYINLYPQSITLEKEYYHYRDRFPYDDRYSIFSPIEPSKEDKKYAKVLIEAKLPYSYDILNKYIMNNMNGIYTSYLLENNKPIFRFYLKMFKNNDNEEFNTKEKIESYFQKNKIDFTFLKQNKEGNQAYLLKRNGYESPAYCLISAKKDKLEIYLTYNAKDTVQSLIRNSLSPYIGKKLEY